MKLKIPVCGNCSQFDKFTFSSDKSHSSNDDKSKSWLEKLFKTEDKPKNEVGILENISSGAMAVGFLLFWVSNGHSVEQGDKQLLEFCVWLFVSDVCFGENVSVGFSEAVKILPGYKEDKGVFCRFVTVL